MMRNIVLIGFMGSGKTSVGQKLSQELALSFVDTDDVIEERAGKSIKQIFTEEGEEAFRFLERKIVREVSAPEGKVIACGGGVVLDPRNVKALKRKGVFFYLKTSTEVICKRTKASFERPLLQVANKKGQIEKLLCLREKTYQEVADFTIDTSNLSINQVVEEIKKKFKQG